MNKAVELHLDGHNPTRIARETGFKQAEVLEYLAEFKDIAKNDELLRERGREVVHDFDEQQNKIQREMWRLADDAETNGDLKVRATVLKNISDVQAKRVEVLQKSGVLADNKIVEEMAETEEKMRILMGILRDVTRTCDHCRIEVARRLSDVAGKSEEIVVVVPEQ